jgi:LemA protein
MFGGHERMKRGITMKGQAKIGLLVIVGLVVLIGGYFATTYNSLIRMHEQIPAAWSQVENVLQRRNDLIPNLVATVKGYAKHEQTVFAQVSDALKSFNRATTAADKLAADNTITSLISRIMAISLQYPNLKADAQFARLSDELAGTENRIAVERMRFIELVRDYNAKVKTFPTNLVARAAGLTASEDYFKAEPTAKTAPKVSFE